MNSYWAFVKTGTGSFIKVTVQAPNSYVAGEILKNTYGQNLQTGPALMTQSGFDNKYRLRYTVINRSTTGKIMTTLKITLAITILALTTGCGALGAQDPAYDGYFNVLNKVFYNNNVAFGG